MKWIATVVMICCLWPGVWAKGAQEAQKLEFGQRLDRAIAGGESHQYQITLAAGQFMRIIVLQRGSDVAVQLITPDGKPLIEAELTDSFGQESLCQEVTAGGDYRIVIRTIAATAPAGAYEAQLEVKTAATAQDKQRIEAERLLEQASKLAEQGGASVSQSIDKAQQAHALWRAMGDRYWEAYTLSLLGYAYSDGNKNDQAIEAYNHALAIRRDLKDRYGEFNTLSGLGWVSYRLNRYEKAIEYY